MIKPILKDRFFHDGRGPELQYVHYFRRGEHILAVDYFNPNDTYNEDSLKHLKFQKPQAFLFTPEEEYRIQEFSWAQFDGAAILDLGKTPWYYSFSNRHSADCRHFQIMFYDEYLDIICENIESLSGGYKETVEVDDAFIVNEGIQNRNESLHLQKGLYAVLKKPLHNFRIPFLGQEINVLNSDGTIHLIPLYGIDQNKNGVFTLRFDVSQIDKVKKGVKLLL